MSSSYKCLNCEKETISNLKYIGSGIFSICEHCGTKIEMMQTPTAKGAPIQYEPWRIVDK